MIAVLLIVADRAGWLPFHRSDDLAAYDGKVAVITRVIDGDTVEISLPDTNRETLTTKVRLWGIDCPEMPLAGRDAEPLADQATQWVEQLALHREVRLLLEPARMRDKYDRVLAHLWLADGRSINESLLEQGLARADDRWSHSMIRRYAQVELAARRRGAGIWALGESVSGNTAPAP